MVKAHVYLDAQVDFDCGNAAFIYKNRPITKLNGPMSTMPCQVECSIVSWYSLKQS